MTDRKTCATCGPAGAVCDMPVDDCPFMLEMDERGGDGPECLVSLHRKEVARAEAAEARIAELEELYRETHDALVYLRDNGNLICQDGFDGPCGECLVCRAVSLICEPHEVAG